MKKIMYVASLNTKKDKYDGERIKSTHIFNVLNKVIESITVINLSKTKYFSTFKMLFLSFFAKKKYEYFIVSKDARGAKIIHKILKFAHVDPQKIIYFEIGPFLYDLLLFNKTKPELFLHDRNIIVETESMKCELEEFGFKNLRVFPNFKTNPHIEFKKKKYPVEQIKLVYFSRIEEKKGIYDLINVLKRINQDKILFTLDVYGLFMSKEDNEKLCDLVKQNDFLFYKGKLDMGKNESYNILASYDLHVFPTHYNEGFPGSLIDFFFVGVPTLSSSFLRFKDILSEDNSFVYKQFDNEDLEKQLIFIYNNQNRLFERSIKTYQLNSLYTTETFEVFLRGLFHE